MVPAAFVVLDGLPRTPNGKVDRRALPAPEETSEQPDDAFEAPATPIEEQLASIFTELLNLKQISVTANIFELGGHSLLALRIIAQVQNRFRVKLPLSSLFETPTVRQLSARIEHLLIAKLEKMSDAEARRLLG